MGRQIGRLVSLLSILTVVLMLLAILPTPAFAQDSAPFVTCSGPDCNICKLVESVSNIISFTIALAVILATIILAYGGFKLVFSKGDPGAISQAKTFLINTVIGVILILAAWTLVDTLMKVLVRDDINNFGAWNKIDPRQCRGQNESGEAVRKLPSVGSNPNTLSYETESGLTLVALEQEVESVGYGGASFNTSGTAVVPNISGMVSLRSSGVQVAEWYGINGPNRTDLAHPQVVAAAKQMQLWSEQRYGKRIFQITAAYTEGVGHSNGSKHYQGIALDFDEINGGTLSQIASLARQAGFTYVLNEGNHIHADMRPISNAQ